MARLEQIAALLRQEGQDALLLTDASPEAMQYATGMHGLEGMVLILADGRGMVLTDSRYIEAADALLTPQGFAVTVPKGGRPCAETLNLLACHEGLRYLAYLDADLSVQAYRRLRDNLTSCKPVAFGNALTTLRAHKDEKEATAITKAQRIAEEAFEVMLGAVKPGVTERELTALLEYEMAKRGSERPSFDTILISGAKTSMPHGMPDDKVLVAGEPILVDFGAVWGGYHSDMTRTFSLGEPGEDFRAIYQIVLEAQKTGIYAISEGASCGAAHRAAHEVIDEAGYGGFFGHALGHGVGLAIHELPSVGASAQMTLQRGNVVTVEPGIYLPGRFGVRIEDMIYLGADGPVNLTNTPKDLLIL